MKIFKNILVLNILLLIPFSAFIFLLAHLVNNIYLFYFISIFFPSFWILQIPLLNLYMSPLTLFLTIFITNYLYNIVIVYLFNIEYKILKYYVIILYLLSIFIYASLIIHSKLV